MDPQTKEPVSSSGTASPPTPATTSAAAVPQGTTTPTNPTETPQAISTVEVAKDPVKPQTKLDKLKSIFKPKKNKINPAKTIFNFFI